MERRSSRLCRPLIIRPTPLAFALAVSLSSAVPALSQEPPAGQNDAPVLLTADVLTFADQDGVVTAAGNVELLENGRVLRADAVTYNVASGIVAAEGNVTLIEPDGTVVYGDYVELTDDLREGFIRNIRVLLTDESRLAAAEAGRLGSELTVLNQAVYSPCLPCEDDPEAPLLWQIKASRVIRDEAAQNIIYHNARLEFFGVPVFYTPYFSHPSPEVERRTGFLSPSFGQTPDLGLFVEGSFYWDVAPDRDATFRTTLSALQSPLLEGEWRQRFDSGSVIANGAVSYGLAPQDDNSLEEELRGHVDIAGRFSTEGPWNWGFDIERTTDPAFLRVYQISPADILTSRAYAEGFFDRDYARVSALSFQDLRPGRFDTGPLVLPYAEHVALGEPGALFGGRWSLDSSAYALVREDGQDTIRIGTEAGWQRHWVSDAGIVTTATASTLVAGYYVQDPADPSTQEGVSGRIFPQAQILSRYPFVRPSGTITQVVEPIVALTMAPSSDRDDLPNEEGLDFELDDMNLFALDRFPGHDPVEGGVRLSYGVRWGFFGSQGGSSSLFLGQEFRLAGEGNYDLASGISDPNSDIVGRLELAPGPYLDVDYRFRLDPDDFDMRRSDLTFSAGVPLLRLSATYSYIAEPPGSVGVEERENLNVAATSRITENWSAGISSQYDLGTRDGPLSASLSVNYQDECYVFSAVANRSFLRRTGVESGDSILFRMTFKNLGTVETMPLSPVLFQ